MADLNVPPDFYNIGPASIECVVVAAQKQAVPANVLLAIASIEGGKNGQMVGNTNGSRDISHFQINTSTWRSRLAPYGVRLEDLQWRGCYNAEIAAWLLHQEVTAPGPQDYWTKAANYHSHTPRFNLIYRKKLIRLSSEWANWLQSNYSVNTVYR